MLFTLKWKSVKMAGGESGNNKDDKLTCTQMDKSETD